MATAKDYATRNGIVRKTNPDGIENDFTIASLFQASGNFGGDEALFVSYDDFNSLKHKQITGIKLWFYSKISYSSGNFGRSEYWLNTSLTPIDYSTLTYNTMPNLPEAVMTLNTSGEDDGQYIWISFETSTLSRIDNIVKNGIVLGPIGQEYSRRAEVYGVRGGTYAPYLEVTYQDPTPLLADITPQNGYALKNAPTTFSWSIYGDGYVVDGVAQDSGTLQWRAGTSGTINSISVGTAQQYTVPGGTFTTDEIQWRISVVAAGTTLISDWYTLSTVEPLPSAKPVSPVSGFVDSTKPITFSWDHVIETGTTQTGFELQAGTDGSAFATVAAETTANEFVTIPAGTFTPGPLYWRVRTYNTDGNPGEWSAVAQVTAIGAPNAPVVTLDDTSPRPSVRWQVSGQQAYEVTVDGVSVARAFGTAKTYRSETYLTDGQHTISVRVQNQYGLWSERGTVSVQIANTAGSAITLTAAGGDSASLTWSTDGIYDKYYVYRDGELLAKTTATSYDDALTNGAHIYQVRGAYDTSGDYGLSNAVNVVIQLESTNIAAVDGTVSIDLPYSETDKRQTTTSVQRQMSTLYFAGSPLPSMEVSEWTDRKMAISAALKAGESLTQIMALVGKLVCARDQYGNCVIGPLPGWTVRSYEMYTTLQATIQDVNWREAIKHDPIT